MRISLSDDLYWRLATLAAKEHMKPIPYLEKWLREEMAKVTDLPHDSSKPRKGTFSDEEIDQIKTMYREGIGPAEMSRRMNGRYKSSISYAINAMKKRGEL